MANPIWFAIRRKAGSVSGKVLTEVAGSALAIIAVTSLSAQFRNPSVVEGAPSPVYRPTLDPTTGKIVDRLAPGHADAGRIGASVVATFLTAPKFVAITNISLWSASRAEATAARSHAISAPAAVETQRATFAEMVPLPPTRAISRVALQQPTTPPLTAEEPKPGRLAQAVSWLSPSRVIDGGTQVLASGRDTVARAVSYSGNALARIYP